MRLVGGGSGDVMCLSYGLLMCFWVTASCVDDNLALVGKDIGVLGSSIHFSYYRLERHVHYSCGWSLAMLQP